MINSPALNYSVANIYKNEANYESGETREIILRGQLTFLPWWSLLIGLVGYHYQDFPHEGFSLQSTVSKHTEDAFFQ